MTARRSASSARHGRGGEAVGYWAVARLQPQHENAGLHLRLNGYEIYYPRVRERRIRHGRRIEVRPPLFWGYCFFVVENGVWYTARWAIGVCDVIRDGVHPARVPDAVIEEIRARERIEVLLQLLGSLQRVELARDTVEIVRS